MGKIMRKNRTWNWAIATAVWTFFLASGFTLFSQIIMQELRSFFIMLLTLLFIILLGILFDIIGTAAAAADEVPLHAKAAKKVYGARRSYQLVRNADKVANYFNDMIGDISGIVSGALATAIMFQLTTEHAWLDKFILSILLTGLVAALTVGGKAIGKMFALRHSTEIMLLTGKLITKLEEYSPVLLVGKLIFVRRK